MLNEFLKTVEYQITHGDEFLWTCYGEDVRILEAATEYGTASCAFNTETGQVFEVCVNDTMDRKQAYRWIDSESKPTYEDEAKARGVDPNQFLDDLNYSDTDEFSDILEKTKAILNNRYFDPQVIARFDLDDDVIEKLAEIAKVKNITIDALMVECLQAAIDNEDQNVVSK